MFFSTCGGLDFSDFLQEAECIVIEQEQQKGKVFESFKDRSRYVGTIAKNRWIDNFRKMHNRKRLLECADYPRDNDRVAEIDAADRIVKSVLNKLKTKQSKEQRSKKFSATWIGTKMASDLIQWELEGLSHREMAGRIFKDSKPTEAATKKISLAHKIAREEFMQECLKIKFDDYE